MTDFQKIADKLNKIHTLTGDEAAFLIENNTGTNRDYLAALARETAVAHFGKKIYLRGLIEFTNYCRNDCLYCGIRRSNQNASRYRLTKEEILSCCKTGFELGFRTFVLQGGEDGYFTDDRMVEIISEIKKLYPECAITLSIGEKSRETYERFFSAGADRYLLRHETADREHYGKLHPDNMSHEHRINCIKTLKEIGFQTGMGFMVGSPYQTVKNLTQDLLLLKEIEPQMVGIGPFIPHCDTPFKEEKQGELNTVLLLISIIRLLLPKTLIPSTTALGTIDRKGRELGILAGANVVMPNLSPVTVRKKYTLYDNKICTGEEAAECRLCLENRIKSIGYEIAVTRGDYSNTPVAD